MTTYDEDESGERLLSTEELAEFLGMAEGSVRNWRQEKKGPPFYRFGNGIIRYRKAEVLEWLDNRRVSVE